MEISIDGLYKAFDHRIRLGIMSALSVNDALDFNSLKTLLNLTDGNLASHIKALEREQYIVAKKSFIEKKPNTQYSVTRAGRKAFEHHLKALEKLIKTQQ